MKNNQQVQQPQESVKKPTDKMSLEFVIPLVLFYLVIGILLVWLDTQVTTIATYVLAGVVLIYGGWMIIKYVKSEVEQRIAGSDLAVGLVLVLSGVLLFIKPSSLDTILPYVWGLSLVFGGFLKTQYAFDEKTVGVKRWWIMLIFAALSLVVGTLALLSRSVFAEDTNRNLIIGIFMIGEAVLDAVTYFVIHRGIKNYHAAKQPQAVVYVQTSTAPAAPEAPRPEEK